MASTSFFLSAKLIGSALLGIGLGSLPAAGAPVWKPALTFKDVRFSQVQHETMERTWSATLSVDASPCATTSGRFEVLFSRFKENAPEMDFTETFVWKPDSVEVSVNFWADEAVEAYWLHNVAACPCRD